MRAKLEALDRQELERIYGTALEMLSVIGVCIEDDEVAELLRRGGCQVDAGNIVHYPPALVERCLRSTPNRNGTTRLCGRDPARDIVIGDQQESPYLIAHVLGEYYEALEKTYRKLTVADIRRFTALVDALDSIDGVWMCTLMPRFQKMYSYCEYELGIRGTTKPVCISSFEPVSIPPAFELAAALAGGERELEARPLSVAFCGISPLSWNRYGCDMFKATARRGIQPVITVEAPQGDTGPVTFAGDIAQKIAEALSGLVIVQLLQEGLPVYFVIPHEVFDQRTVQCCLASRGDFVWAGAVGQLEAHLGIPIISPISPDSKELDLQEAYELSFSLLPRLLGGNKATVIHGLDQTHAISVELLMLLDEMMISSRRIIRGIDVNDDTLAFAVLKEVAAKVENKRRTGHFLDQRHTLSWYAKEHLPRRDNIIDKHRRENWLAGGSKSLVQRAHERVEEILRKHQPLPLPAAIEKEIARIRKRHNIPDFESA
jgi:trimethylamine--corrinoid protein Co-methyltransferase